MNGAATIGCSGESILCNGEELEDQGAVAVWLAHLPGVAVRPMHLEFSANREGGSFRGWPEDASLPDVSGLIMLADPFSFPADVFIARLNEDRPGTTVVGGMASGGWQPGQTRLMLGGDELASGAVAVLLDGAVRMRTVVSQGCRPIGRPFVVTRCERNAILELGGQNALAQIDVFTEVAGVTGLVMTKLDGTARGGVLVAAAEQYGLPIHAIGVGEKIDDLRPFDPDLVARVIAGVA